ncbi:hypothetical protein [Victivallis vadensis]|uniref:hypothetical protein n=1 Tax=Victivallis vadensis TaxID=172901 RepID=UPI0014024BC9|nr:hypothetical protein [Victivallis vadensis]
MKFYCVIYTLSSRISTENEQDYPAIAKKSQEFSDNGGKGEIAAPEKHVPHAWTINNSGS